MALVVGAVVVAVASIASAVVSSSGAKKAAAKKAAAAAAALAYQKKQISIAVNELQAVGVPTLEAQKIVMQNPQLAGLEEIIELPKSEVSKIETDAGLSMQQRESLATISDMGEAGLTPEETAQRRTLMRSVSAQSEARDKAISQEMMERGQTGGGQELAMKLAASQAGAERGAQEASDLSAQANQRALNAIMMKGQLAGDIRSQEFSEKMNKAQAADAITKFNVAQRSDVQNRNLARKQSIMDEKTRLANQQEIYNKELIAKNYQQKLAKAQAIANARLGQMSQSYASNLGRSNDAIAQYDKDKAGATGQAIQGVGSAIGGYAASSGSGTTAK